MPHIMISYQWNVKPEVLKFVERLRIEGYRVWIDTEQMHKSECFLDILEELYALEYAYAKLQDITYAIHQIQLNIIISQVVIE